MTALILRRFRPEPGLVLRRFGPDQALAPLAARSPPGPISVAIGPPGPTGPAGAPVRFDVNSAAATWIIPHGLGREPQVQVFLPGGEQVSADVSVDTVHITITFASAQTGFVLAS